MSEQTVGKKKQCCEVPVNLEQRVQVSESMWVSICRICGCKHWEAKADPLHLGIKAL